MARLSTQADASTAEIIVDAPGHSFHCGGPGIEVQLEVEGERLVSAEGRFPLAALTTGDPLGRRELRKFLNQDAQPYVQASLQAPVELAAGEAQLLFSVDGGPQRPLTARWEHGQRPAPGSQLSLQVQGSFSGFGYKPPKLLFIRVKDAFSLQLRLQLGEA